MWEFGQGLNIYIKKYCFHYFLLLRQFNHIRLCGLMVTVLAFHADDLGSIPGRGENFVVFLLLESI